MSQERIRILVVDDHPMILKGLQLTLGAECDMEVVGSAATGAEAVKLFRELRPDVAIMDVGLTPEMTGTEATRSIRREFPNARIVMFSVHKGEEDIFRALEAGATTYLLKGAQSEEIPLAIREVCAGQRNLPHEVAAKLAQRALQAQVTPREEEVLALIAEGLRNKEIADRLGISENTVLGHVRNILSKLEVTDRTGAVTAAIRRGILHIE